MVKPGHLHPRDRRGGGGLHPRPQGAKPAFKGYRGFPATVCISINEEVVHGIPSARAPAPGGRHRRPRPRVHRGGLLRGLRGDPARRARSPPRRAGAARRDPGEPRPGHRAVPRRDAGSATSPHAVQQHVRGHGFSVVRAFVGHGIGRALHEEPQVPNFGEPGRGPLLRPGMVLAIEPMVTMGRWEVRVLEDRWTAVTADGSLAAHFEHTIAVTEDGPEVLTATQSGRCERRRGSPESGGMSQGRRDRGGGHGGRAVAQRDVPGRAGQRPPGAGARRRARCACTSSASCPGTR